MTNYTISGGGSNEELELVACEAQAVSAGNAPALGGWRATDMEALNTPSGYYTGSGWSCPVEVAVSCYLHIEEYDICHTPSADMFRCYFCEDGIGFSYTTDLQGQQQPCCWPCGAEMHQAGEMFGQCPNHENEYEALECEVCNPTPECGCGCGDPEGYCVAHMVFEL
jgi:hypothetical protein